MDQKKQTGGAPVGSERKARQRSQELEQNAQKYAYSNVPTQEEMLNGGKPVKKKVEKLRSPDPELTKKIDDESYTAAQEGNIGGG